MVGLKLNFAPGEVTIDTNSKVTDFDATIQNALVNIATRSGTDKIYPSKGTELLKRALEGRIVGLNSANHEAQVAAVSTLFFSREYETDLNVNVRLGRVNLSPITYENGLLKLAASFTDQAQSRTVGTTTLL